MYSHVACDVMKERTVYLLKPSSLIWHLMPYLFLSIMTCIWPFQAELSIDFHTTSSQIKVSNFFNTGGGIALYPTINNNDRVASDSYSAVRMTGFPKKSI